MNKLKLLSIILLLLSSNLCMFSQNYCTTFSDIPDFLQGIPSDQYVSSRANDYYIVRVFFHIIRRTDGTGGQSLSEVNTAFNILKTDYQVYGICFELLGIDEILDDNTYDRTSFISNQNGDGKFENFNPNSHSNAIDIYLFASDRLYFGLAAGIPASALVIGGTAYNTNLVTSHVLSHEIGHCLGLYHTFHGLCEGGCAELVNGSNCSECGDFICDTPADPQMHEVGEMSCLWSGSTCGISNKDANGDLYNPRTDLIMAYIPPNCMQYHTSGQMARMKAIMTNHPMLQKVVITNEFTLSGTLTGNNNYSAIETITSTQIISSGSTSYEAGSEIILKPGFHAIAGSNFNAYISSTNYSCDEKNLHLYHDQENEESHDHSHSATLQTHQNLSLQEVIQNRKITIHPNPNNGSFNIETNFPLTDIGNLKITNLMGATVYETQKVASNTVQLQNPAKGTYFVVMILKDGSVLTRKMVVQ